MKRILTVQDISCLGKCSLTVALPILSALGVETAVLPTAVLSTHTAFPNPAICDLTSQIPSIVEHWQTIGAEFDGIYSGYLGSSEQVDGVLELAQRFAPGMLFVDPVMGDNGKLYSGFDAAFVEKMKTLCAKAQVIVPNITEACLLTDTPYCSQPDEAFVEQLLAKLSSLCPGTVLLTGAAGKPGTTGAVGREPEGNTFSYFQEKLPQNFHGTGDAFSAVCAGMLLQGKSLAQTLPLAAEFTARCIQFTMEENRDKRYGLCFEKALPYLCEKT